MRALTSLCRLPRPLRHPFGFPFRQNMPTELSGLQIVRFGWVDGNIAHSSWYYYIDLVEWLVSPAKEPPPLHNMQNILLLV